MIEDGAPVEYQQVVVEIAPFFGGEPKPWAGT